MRTFVFTILVCSAIGCSGKSGVDPGVAEASAIASRDGAPALERIASSLGTGRAAALASAQSAVASSFVIPIIDDRVAAIDAALPSIAASPALEGATIVALSSDGSVFSSKGSVGVTPFTRPFANVPCVTLALSSSRPGRCFEALLGLRVYYEIFVEPVRVDGAVVGALIALETRESIAGRVRDRVRASNRTLASVGVCLQFESDDVCVDVPEEARRAASDAASRQPRPRRRTIESAAIGGAIVAIDLANWPTSSLVFVHIPRGGGTAAH